MDLRASSAPWVSGTSNRAGSSDTRDALATQAGDDTGNWPAPLRFDVLLAEREDFQQCHGFLGLLERGDILQHSLGLSVLSNHERLALFGEIGQRFGGMGTEVADGFHLGRMAHDQNRRD
jgi:hypothetical protein